MVVNSKEKEEEATKIIAKTESYWIGLRDPPPSNFVYAWVDGSKPTYTNWKSYAPVGGIHENCVTIDGYDGKWENRPCNIPDISSICEI